MICILKNTLLVIIVCSVVGFVSIAHAAEGSNAEKQQLFEKLMLAWISTEQNSPK